jgi:hypothetical protein
MVVLTTAVLLLVVVLAFGQTPIYTNQVTVAWDEVAPLEPSDVIAYEVFRSPFPITGDRQDPADHESLGELTPTSMSITFAVEGDYVIGVRTVRMVSGGEIVYSDINWSDENGEFTPNPFIVKFYKAIQRPKNLRYE